MSQNSLASIACTDEVNRAMELSLPTFTLLHDVAAWSAAIDNGLSETYQSMLESATILPENADGFFEFRDSQFWENFTALVTHINQHLPVNNTVVGLIICADEDVVFANGICSSLNSAGHNTIVCSNVLDWESAQTHHHYDHEGLSMILPVLSTAFYSSTDCTALIEAVWFRPQAHVHAIPIRLMQQPRDVHRNPFLCSILDRANRVPANEDFGTGECPA